MLRRVSLVQLLSAVVIRAQHPRRHLHTRRRENLKSHHDDKWVRSIYCSNGLPIILTWRRYFSSQTRCCMSRHVTLFLSTLLSTNCSGSHVNCLSYVELKDFHAKDWWHEGLQVGLYTCMKLEKLYCLSNARRICNVITICHAYRNFKSQNETVF
jgi:hypothetical protein